jgi:nucleotide-binding universal stress UspA family protein
VIIGFDGTPAAERAVRECGTLLAPRRAIVVVVIEQGRAFAKVMAPAMTAGRLLTELDVRTGERAEEAVIKQAKHLAQTGAALAQEAGFEAEGLVVADVIPVASTIARVADEHDAVVIAVGARRRGGLGGLLLGSTTKALLKRTERPALVVRDPEDRIEDDEEGAPGGRLRTPPAHSSV